MRAILQYYWLQIGLAEESEFHAANSRQIANYRYSAFKMLRLVGKDHNSIAKLIEFCEAYFWKDLTILTLDVQKDLKVFSEAFNTLSRTELGMVSTYTEVIDSLTSDTAVRG